MSRVVARVCRNKRGVSNMAKGFSYDSAKIEAEKIQRFWQGVGQTKVRAWPEEISGNFDDKPIWVVRSNIVELGLLNSRPALESVP